MPENKVDGNRTLGENVCDSGGLAHAWTAYKKSRALGGGRSKPEFRLPGVNYTDDQLFFITYGQVGNRFQILMNLLTALEPFIPFFGNAHLHFNDRFGAKSSTLMATKSIPKKRTARANTVPSASCKTVKPSLKCSSVRLVVR